MTKRLILVLVVVALVMLVLPVAAASPGNHFVGSWENTDAFDGSHQHMSIGGGPNLPVWYRDDNATACLNPIGSCLVDGSERRAEPGSRDFRSLAVARWRFREGSPAGATS